MAASGSGEKQNPFASVCGLIPFSDDQISVMKEISEQCPNPFPALCNLDDTQLQAWSENQRNFVHKDEESDAKERRERLTATNKFLKEENCKLKKQVKELHSLNVFLKQQLMNIP